MIRKERIIMKNIMKKIMIPLIVAVMMLFSPVLVYASETVPKADILLEFSEGGITAKSGSSAGYEISGTELIINEAGTYKVTGKCSEGTIVVKKGTENVTLILEDLTLSNSTTAPVLLKKSTGVTMYIFGTVSLYDRENIANEGSEDFEGAAIKVNSEGSVLRINGTGTLNIDGTACKNGIKAGENSKIIIDGCNLNDNAANHGIASDGSVTINGGVLTIKSENEGIKSVPDDATSEGTVTINGGTINITSTGDAIQAMSKVEINGGNITITTMSDGIQSSGDISITNGVFNIKSMSGYKSSGFDSNTMSCKGIKSSAEDTTAGNTISISGGTFAINTPDDCIHSDGYISITGGSFEMYSGDDGIHADVDLSIGTDGGYDRDPEITVNYSYEGLEGAKVYIYSGKIYVTASDDGINSAGGAGSGSNPMNPGFGGGDNFRPGSRNQGGFGGRMENVSDSGIIQASSAWGTYSSDYALYVYGGNVYVNCTGDGLDSNGNLYLYGGNITVLSQAAGGDNSPLDSDGSIIIDGAVVFAAGSNQMNETPASSGQKYYVSSSYYGQGTVINVSSNGQVVYCERLPRNCNYILYSNPSLSNCSITAGTTVSTCNSNSFAHAWDNGSIVSEAAYGVAGTTVFTCGECGKTEYKTIPGLYYTDTEIIVPQTTDPDADADIREVDSPSAWAEEEVRAAIAAGLVPDYLQNNYTLPVTRGQVTEMIVNLLEKALGKSIDEIIREKNAVVSLSKFYDTDDYNVYASNALGIIKGTSDSTFTPDGVFKRAQIAAIVNRVAGVCGIETSGFSHEFEDLTDNYAWVDTELGWPSTVGIINGVSSTRFNPGAELTVEQAILITYRAYQVLSK